MCMYLPVAYLAVVVGVQSVNNVVHLLVIHVHVHLLHVQIKTMNHGVKGVYISPLKFVENVIKSPSTIDLNSFYNSKVYNWACFCQKDLHWYGLWTVCSPFGGKRDREFL